MAETTFDTTTSGSPTATAPTPDVVTDPVEVIAQRVTEPDEVVTDGLRVKNTPVGDLIAAAEYLKKQQAAASGGNTGAVRFTKLIPPGTV